MKNKILITCTILLVILAVMVIGWELYVERGTMYESLEFMLPLLIKKETISLQSGRFFDNEELKKIYLSKRQARKILEKIENNNNWINEEIDEKLEERLKFHTRENIYNQIPYIENKYWIFTNRSSAAKEKHTIDEVINDLYYAISFGVFDIDNSILYYYEYDR